MNMPLFDAHCDTAFKMALEGYGLFENPGHTDLKRGLEYTPYAQFYALFAMEGKELPLEYPSFKGKSIEEIFSFELERLLKELQINEDRISLCTTAHEAKEAFSRGKAAAFLSIEGAELIGCDLQRLNEMHKLGVRALNLTWNNPNELVCEAGLSDLGRQFVKRCNDLNIIIDVSHLSDAAFWDVLSLSKNPIMASHSNARALFNHRRNLNDDQFVSIINNKGIVGINLYSAFLGEHPDINTVIGHIDHFLSLGGARNIALGCDFDGCDDLPDGIKGIESMKDVYNAFLRQNYPEKLINDIFFNNLMRVVGDVCDI